jgi:L-rhamnose isomerase/sugar isomerase
MTEPSLLSRLESAIQASNAALLAEHRRAFDFLSERLDREGVNTEQAIQQLVALDVAAPSWALGAGGTRYFRYRTTGEPADVQQKLDDIAALRRLTGTIRSVSLHIPWDHIENPASFAMQARELGIGMGPINSNTFQDHSQAPHSYKFGSLSNTKAEIRRQAIEHNIEVIRIGQALGCSSLSIWVGDGANHPGQQHLRRAADRMSDSLQQIYQALPADWELYLEHKPFEPASYSTVNCDWGASLMLAREIGERCRCLVDLGHHLPGANIEQVVAYLLRLGRLGGFHFNDAKYADDDLTVGSLRPFMLFLIFHELVQGMMSPEVHNPKWSYMIDESHNIKDPLEDLIQSTEAIQIAMAQALIVNVPALEAAQEDNDATMAQAILQRAFRHDVAPLVMEARLRLGSAIDPLQVYRQLGYRALLTAQRGTTVATGF